MTHVHRLLIVLLVSMFLHQSGASGQEESPAQEGKDITDAFSPVGKTTYHDNFAGLTLEVPPDAVVMADGKVQELAKESHELVKKRSSRFRKAIEKGYKSKTLFRLHLKRPKDAKTVAILPGIAAWQEELKGKEVTPERFLMNLRKAMQQSSDIQYHKNLLSKKVDKLTFHFQLGEIKVKTADKVITGIQEQHVVMLDDRAIGFALTYNTVAEGNVLRNIVWSMKLDEKE